MATLVDWGGKKLDATAQLAAFERFECEESLAEFLRHGWQYIDTAPFQDGWVIDAIAQHLEAVVDGDIKRLMIHVPPRCSKSSICSVAFPAWVWLQPFNGPTSGPGVPIVSGSYSFKLSVRDASECRRLIKSPWYQGHWGHRVAIADDNDQKIRFGNKAGGERLVISVDGGVTGEGGNIIIIDDPNNAKEVLSDAVVETTNEDWWDGTMSTRLNDPRTGAYIVIQQRLGENDLSGHIMRKSEWPEWTHLCYDDQTEILTRRGWLRFTDLIKGEDVMAVDPATLTAQWERPTNYIRRHYAGPLKLFKSMTADLAVTPDHRMVYGDVNDMQGGAMQASWRVRSATDLPGDFYLPQVVGWKGSCKPVVFAGREWEPGNFAEFMGWYLSEGCASARARTTRLVQKDDGNHVDHLMTVLAASPFHAGRSRHCRDGMSAWQIKDRFLARALEPLGTSLSKRAPAELKKLAPEFLRLFLLAYARGDGHFAVRNEAKITIGTGSAQMADDLQECAVKAGWASSLTIKHQAGGEVFNGYVRPPSTVYSLYLRVSKVEGCERKIASKIRPENTSVVSYDGMVYCVSVPSSAIVVRRNGRVSVSGNCLPMEYESRRSFVTSIGWKDPRDADGELLWPARFGHSEVASLKSNLGSWRAAGQLQQRPEPQGGGIIKRAHWQLWPPGGEELDDRGQPVKPAAYPPMDYILACLDSAYTTDTMNDPSALTIWGVFSGETVAKDIRYGNGLQSHRVYGEAAARVMLMYAWSGRMELHQLVAHVAKLCQRKAPGLAVDKLLIEAKASGISVAQEMRRLFAFEGFGIQLYDPGRVDKVARLYSVQNIFEENTVFAPDRSWAEEVIAQCGTFPNATHDDLVDTVSMALRHLRDIGMLSRPAERMADLDEGLNVLSRRTHAPLYPG